uniref:Uncharacterized protein n=1 Tax=Knipowitschia caucasica TaxID=637954 RepID=A0AAV2MIY9_KNICA
MKPALIEDKVYFYNFNTIGINSSGLQINCSERRRRVEWCGSTRSSGSQCAAGVGEQSQAVRKLSYGSNYSKCGCSLTNHLYPGRAAGAGSEQVWVRMQNIAKIEHRPEVMRGEVRQELVVVMSQGCGLADSM